MASPLLNSYLEALQAEQQVIEETLEMSGSLVFPHKQRGFDSQILVGHCLEDDTGAHQADRGTRHQPQSKAMADELDDMAGASDLLKDHLNSDTVDILRSR